MLEYLEYALESEALILGERVKGGLFRPSCKTLRWSTITMALRKIFGSNEIHAVGVINEYGLNYFVYSPTERVTKISKVPLQVEVLNNVNGMIYIVKNIFQFGIGIARYPDKILVSVSVSRVNFSTGLGF